MEDFRSDLDPEALHCLNHIQQAIHNMGHLVDGLLNLSRLSRKDMSRQRVVLGELVEEARAELEPDIAGRNVSWQIGVLPTVLGDPFLLKQVFVNLLANAIKFTRLREPAVIQVSQQATNGETIIFVRDNGVGFNMKYAEKLFGVFQRLHAPEQFEGTGVGLATVQRIIHKHGGRIWAESEPDQGACFFFSLAARPVSTVGVYPVSDKMTS
jgi:light-regulated signal transduction histidine kinase (bacteriophytochrome)